MKEENIQSFKMKNNVFFIVCFDCTHNMWKFLGQGLNPHHSRNPSYCSDNAGSLALYAQENFTNAIFFN